MMYTVSKGDLYKKKNVEHFRPSDEPSFPSKNRIRNNYPDLGESEV